MLEGVGVLSRFKKWAEREHSKKQRIIALLFEGIIFVVALPLLLEIGSSCIDRWICLQRFVYGLINPIIALLFIGTGLPFAIWSIQVLFSVGRGTPAPTMPTQKLIVQGPYAYCRNPIAFGTTVFYLGISIWIGSFSAAGLTLLFAVLLLTYIRLVEERELEERFGLEYSKYKKQTPFLIPRLWKRN
jgi:protein-S-isoprenylcysteine O-methyltransferase Ste14